MVISVLVKYAGHAGHIRQTSADVRQRAQTLPDKMSGKVQYTEDVQEMSGIKHNILLVSNGEKCPIEDQNVRQGF